MNDDIQIPALDACDPLTLTVLRAEGIRRLAKRFYVAPDGSIARQDFDSAVWFTPHCISVTDIGRLHAEIVGLEAQPDHCVIRGAMAMPPGTRTRRLKAEFPETKRRWLMLDIDGADLLPGLRVADDPRGGAYALVEAVARFAPELDDVSTVVRWSTSAGTIELAEHDERWSSVSRSGASAHVWCLLSEPVGEAELTAWIAKVNARAGFRLLDPATIRTVQPHYTASPVFSDGLSDPLLGERTHLVRGCREEAALALPEAEKPVAVAPTIKQQKALSRGRSTGVIEHDASGIVVDGRDDHLSRIAFRLVREAAERGDDPACKAKEITAATWTEFASTADLLRPRSNGLPWCPEVAATKVGQKIASLGAGTPPGSPRQGIARILAALRALGDGR